MKLHTDDILGGQYKVRRKIGAGSFGEIYLDGIPQVHTFGQDGDLNYMVIDILGPSLEDLFNYCGRDIKPDNFLMGLKDKSHIAFVVDYGLAKRFYDPRTKTHIPYRNDKSLTGTARYASIHAHLGEELSRRDDLEAVGFVMLYFYKGQLPWQNLPAFSKSEKYRRIKETKVAITLEELCQESPTEFLTYLKHCRNLEFEQKPDYDLLLNTLNSLAAKEGLDMQDKVYDWVIKDAKVPRPVLIQQQQPEDLNKLPSLLNGNNQDAQPALNANEQALNQQQNSQQNQNFQFAGFLEAQRMIRGDQLRNMMLDIEHQRGANNAQNDERQLYKAYNEEIRRREIEQLKQEYKELRERGYKRKNQNPNGAIGVKGDISGVGVETYKKEVGPIINQTLRNECNQLKKNEDLNGGNIQFMINSGNNNLRVDRNIAENMSSEIVEERYDEGVLGNIDSKSFGAKPSKFQTHPNKKRNKVIIIDDEEEKEFGIHTSINNHVSVGTIHNQNNRMMSHVGMLEGSSYYPGHNVSQMGVNIYNQDHTPERSQLDHMLGINTDCNQGYGVLRDQNPMNNSGFAIDRSKSTHNCKRTGLEEEKVDGGLQKIGFSTNNIPQVFNGPNDERNFRIHQEKMRIQQQQQQQFLQKPLKFNQGGHRELSQLKHISMPLNQELNGKNSIVISDIKLNSQKYNKTSVNEKKDENCIIF